MKDLTIFRKFDKEIHKGFRPKLEEKLNPKEMELLLLIKNVPEEQMRFYGKTVGLEKGSFTYLSDLLETKGLVNKVNVDIDRRSKTLSLTKKGVAIVKRIEDSYQTYLDERFKAFTKEDFILLDKAVDIIGKLESKLAAINERGDYFEED